MNTLTNSAVWLAAGWTMFQFFWIGAITGVMASAIRSSLAGTLPRVRYAVALLLFVSTAVLPAFLFFTSLDTIAEQRLAVLRDEATTLSLLTTSRASPPLSKGGPGGGAPQSAGPPFAAPVLPATAISSLCGWLPWLWISGTPAALVVLTCGVFGADRLRREARPLDERAVTALCRRLQTTLGVAGQVAVSLSDRVRAPLLVGILRPTILLPSAVLACCSPAQLEMILIHELAHIRRWDNLVNLGQRLIEAALFFHPTIWWLSGWVRLEREQCCDSVVLEHTASPQLYAETLAALALPGITLPSAAVAMTSGPLETRLRHILQIEEETMSLSRKALWIGMAIVVVAGGLVAGWFAIEERAATRLAARVREFGPSNESLLMPVEKGARIEPREIARVSKGPYRVASPDVLSIEVASKLVRATLEVGDEIVIRGASLLPIDPQSDPDLNAFKRIAGPYQVQADGTVDLGPEYGSVGVAGKSIAEARLAIVDYLCSAKVGLSNPKISVSMPVVAVKPVITGEHKILPDGTIWLGEYGSISLDGLTLDEVKTAVETHLQKFMSKPEVRLGVVAFHSR